MQYFYQAHKCEIAKKKSNGATPKGNVVLPFIVFYAAGAAGNDSRLQSKN
jgi:hypothetical protein